MPVVTPNERCQPELRTKACVRLKVATFYINGVSRYAKLTKSLSYACAYNITILTPILARLIGSSVTGKLS